MPRGGKRTPSEGKKIGRPKQERVVDASFAARVKKRVKAEELWVFTVMTAAKKAKETGNTGDLQRALEYLDDRDWGRVMEHTTSTVNHLHDKPIDMNVTHSISERLRMALEKAEQRVSKRRS